MAGIPTDNRRARVLGTRTTPRQHRSISRRHAPAWVLRWRTRTASALGALALTALLAACSGTSASLSKGPAAVPPGGSGSTGNAPGSSQAADSSAPPSGEAGSWFTPGERGPSAAGPDGKGERTVTTLGALHPPPDFTEVGAPYDPCTVVTWSDFPEKVRPRAAKPRKPTPHTPDENSAYAIACAWEANGPVVRDANGASTGAGMFSTWIVWGKTGEMNPNPPKSTPATFGSAQGSLTPNTTSQGAPMCTGFAVLPTGVAGVSVLNSRVPQVDPCTLATDLLTRIATG